MRLKLRTSGSPTLDHILNTRTSLLPLILIYSAFFLAAFAPSAIRAQRSTLRVDPSTRLERILLLLKPSSQQQNSLDTLLVDQQTPGSPEFHKWLTPAQFAARFEPSQAVADLVSQWLRSQGFEVSALPESRAWIEFSGTVAQVQKSFGSAVIPADFDSIAPLYKLTAPANLSASLPAIIAPLVQGLVSLDGTQAIFAATATAESSAESSASPSLAPVDVAKLLYLPASPNGSDQTIAFPSKNTLHEEDFNKFRTNFGLLASKSESSLLIRPDGGVAPFPTTQEEAGMIAALSWAGVAAPDATLLLIPTASTNATDGLDLALANTIERATTLNVRTISVGYAICEPALSPAHQAFYASLYRQAAAEGIAVIAAVGNSGAVACYDSSAINPTQSGLSVNALASTQWNTAVGAAALSQSAIENPPDASTTPSLEPWHSSLSSVGPAFATGGGASRLYPTPLWQSGQGLPSSDPARSGASSTLSATHHRYLPDLSLPAAEGSASAAAIFAGIAADIAQRFGPQGNLAPNLYRLARSNPAIFQDITQGSAKLPCDSASPACVDGLIGFDAAPGYDLASGLGSIDAESLIDNWATPEAIGTAAVSVVMTTAGGVTYNPSATVTLSATVTSGTNGSRPTGTVQFYDETLSTNVATPVTVDSNGNAVYPVTSQFTKGGHNIAAKYSGDSTYESLESQPVTINIQPSPTSMVVTPSTTTPTGGSTITVVGSVIATNPGTAAPTGSINITLDGVSQGSATLSSTGSTTSASVSVTVPASGSHTIQGTYAGDANYNSSASSPVVLATTLAPVTVTLTSSTAVLSPGQAVTLTATVTPVSTPPLTAEQHPSGYVLFYAGTILIGTQASVQVGSGDSGVASTSISNLPAGSYVLTAVYSGDTTYGPATSNSLNLQVEDFTVSCSQTSVNVVQGTSGSVNCDVASLGGLSGAIQVVCAEQNPPNNGAIGCTLSPSIVEGTGTTTLTAVTTAGNLAENDLPAELSSPTQRPPGSHQSSQPKAWPAAASGFTLALAGLLLSPIGRRARLLRKGQRLLALTLMLAGMAGIGLGCTNNPTIPNPGTPLGEHTLKITAAALVNTVTVTHTTYLTVNVTAPAN